jgi:hypothetical protein
MSSAAPAGATYLSPALAATDAAGPFMSTIPLNSRQGTLT